MIKFKRLRERKTKIFLLNLVVLLCSLFFAIILFEVGVRLFADERNYLETEIIWDPILGVRIPPFRGDADSLGFRNFSVPADCDILTLGDSNTWGQNATIGETWPSQLAEITGKTVYNLSLGTYGPPQYWELLRRYGLALKPELVIVGFFITNDISGSYKFTYTLEYYAPYRNTEIKVNSQREPSPVIIKYTGLVRWLKRNSVSYQILKNSPIFDYIRYFKSQNEKLQLPYINYGEGYYTLLDGRAVSQFDSKKIEVIEGMRLTKLYLQELVNLCAKSNIELLILFIPSKERIFEEIIRRDAVKYKGFLEVIGSEKALQNELTEYFAGKPVRFYDLTPALQSAFQREQIFPGNIDYHFLPAGYRAVAEAVAGEIKE